MKIIPERKLKERIELKLMIEKEKNYCVSPSLLKTDAF